MTRTKQVSERMNNAQANCTTSNLKTTLFFTAEDAEESQKRLWGKASHNSCSPPAYSASSACLCVARRQALQGFDSAIQEYPR